MTPETFAQEAYEHYCVAVGGRAFNGLPLPTWEEFANDPSKEKQVGGWLAVGDYINGQINPPSDGQSN